MQLERILNDVSQSRQHNALCLPDALIDVGSQQVPNESALVSPIRLDLANEGKLRKGGCGAPQVLRESIARIEAAGPSLIHHGLQQGQAHLGIVLSRPIICPLAWWRADGREIFL